MSDERDPNDPVGEEMLIMGTDFQGVAERPKSLSRDDLTGTEDIGADEIRLPRLAIAQGLSFEMTPGDARYIEGLKMFEFFNDLTQTVYGHGPITFVPLRHDIRRMEFLPRDEGGGLIDPDVPPGDPRLKWTKNPETGERTPPRATTFSEFIVFLLRPGKAPEPIVISMKETNKFNRRAAVQLRTFIKLRNAAIYAGLYTVASKPEKNDKGTFGTFVVKNAGFIPKDTPSGQALFAYAERFAKSLEGKEIIVNRDTSTTDAMPDDETEHDPSRTEPAAGSPPAM